MSAASVRDNAFITAARAAARQIWDGYHALRELQTQWNALGYGSAIILPPAEDPNAGITGAEVGAAVFDTADEIKLRIFDTAHQTNLAKLL